MGRGDDTNKSVWVEEKECVDEGLIFAYKMEWHCTSVVGWYMWVGRRKGRGSDVIIVVRIEQISIP
jgi:hypothetical protein